MTSSFVIPAYKNYSLIHQLLWDIYKKCEMPYEVIVTENGEDESIRKGVEWWNKFLPIKHLKHENVGFLKNSNIGLKYATGDVVYLVSTDVQIHKNLDLPQEIDGLWGGRYLDWDTGWNTFNGKIFPYLEGWLLATSKSIWEKLEYFDERYAPNDMEDLDLSTKALEAGFRLNWWVENYATHLGAQTLGYNPERENITKTNKRKFEEKWVKVKV